MAEISDYKPDDNDVKNIWSDTYRLFLRYKDVDCMDYQDEINLACENIGDNYKNCDLSARLISAVLRVFLDRSTKYEQLIKDKGD